MIKENVSMCGSVRSDAARVDARCLRQPQNKNKQYLLGKVGPLSFVCLGRARVGRAQWCLALVPCLHVFQTSTLEKEGTQYHVPTCLVVSSSTERARA